MATTAPLKQRTCRYGHLSMRITHTSTKPAPEQVHHLMCKLVQTVFSKKCRESKQKSPTRWPEARFEVIQPQVLSSPCRRKTPLFSEKGQRLRTGALLVGGRSSCDHPDLNVRKKMCLNYVKNVCLSVTMLWPHIPVWFLSPLSLPYSHNTLHCSISCFVAPHLSLCSHT